MEVSFTPRPLYPQGKIPRYSLEKWLGGPQNRSGHGGGEKNSQPLPGIEPPMEVIKTRLVGLSMEDEKIFFLIKVNNRCQEKKSFINLMPVQVNVTSKIKFLSQ
jgi:hypothetical protein